MGASLSEYTWRSSARAVLAIAKKDCLHVVRYPMNAFFRIFQPIMWLVPVYFLGKSFASPHGNTGFAAYAGTGDYMSFILLGTVLSNYISAVFWGMGFALKNEMDEGVLETNWMAPLPRPLFLVGQTLANVAITTLNSAAMLAIAWLLFGFHVTGNVLAALGAIVPLLISIYGFGFAFAALVLLMREANTLVDVSDYVLSMLAGSSFPVRALPWFLLPLSLALPLTYGYDAVRGDLLHARTLLPMRDEIIILLAFMGVMVVLGCLVFRKVERRCKALGTLGLH